MTKRKLMEMIKTERGKFIDRLDQISSEDKLVPGVENNWSVKDIMAHISAWERKMRLWMDQILAGEVPDRPPPGEPWPELDQLNQKIYQENRDKSLNLVTEEFNSSFLETLQLVSSIPEEDLVDPQRHDWSRGDPLYFLVGGNTFWHYEEHLVSLENWIKSKNSL